MPLWMTAGRESMGRQYSHVHAIDLGAALKKRPVKPVPVVRHLHVWLDILVVDGRNKRGPGIRGSSYVKVSVVPGTMVVKALYRLRYNCHSISSMRTRHTMYPVSGVTAQIEYMARKCMGVQRKSSKASTAQKSESKMPIPSGRLTDRPGCARRNGGSMQPRPLH